MICGAEMATLCKPMIAPAWTSTEFEVKVDDASSALTSSIVSLNAWREANSFPMIAKGAHSVRAHERPTEATTKVAAAWEVTKRVENMANAKNAWL